jgi:hypothetical protein
MTFKIPTNFKGYDGKKELEKILNEVPKKEIVKDNNKSSPIIQPSGDLRFITDVKEYSEIVKYLDKEFLENKNVLSNKLSFDNVMKGSNTYIATAVDMFFKKYHPEYRLATQLDLEQDLPFTKNTYNDSGLALRNLTGNNQEQAVYLFEQLKQKGFKEKDLPIWINLRGLDLNKDLNFNLTDESFYKTAECLNWKNGTKFSKINDFGVPKEKDDSSTRQIWTSEYALSGCYLNTYSYLDSDDSDLSDSGDDGRVVLAKVRST